MQVKSSLSHKKKALFALFSILLTIILLLVIEMSLRLFRYGNNLSLFTKSANYPGYYEANRMVGKRFFTKLPATSSINDLFLIDKPDSCYRIFILGASTAQGFPYQSGVSFGRILNYRLQDAFPDKLIEVVNLAMVATNSYTLADFIDEILDKKPDAILIYSGHNEYYGALGVGSVENGGNVRWMKRLNLTLVHLRTYQLIQQIIGKTFKAFSGDLTDNPTATLMEHIAKEKAIEYDSKLFHAGIEQYRNNIGELLAKCKKQKVPVLIGELASNIRDIKPFKSITSSKQPLADSIFALAKKYDTMGSYEQARKLYEEAKDLDGIRFRAPEALNKTIHQLAQKYNVPVVPVKSAFESNSLNGIIGNQLMLEHLHPNVDGYFLMADAYFKAMKNNGFISKSWNEILCKPNEYYRNNWGFTALDSLVADLSVKKLMAGWPFKPDTVVNRFRFTYQPVSYIDSMAFMCIKYNNVSVFNQHIELAKMYEKSGSFMKAFEEYHSLIKSNPHELSLYLTATDLLIKANNSERAIGLLKSLPSYATNYSVLVKLGQVYRSVGDWAKAISELKKAVELSENNADKETSLVLLYDSYIQASLENDAKVVLSQLIEINPKHKSLASEQKVKIVMAKQQVKPLLDSAVVLAREGKLTNATEILNRSLKLEETSFAYSMLGSISFQTDKGKALGYFQKAYQLDNKDANVLNNLCVLSIMKKDFAMATKYLEELKLVSNNVSQIEGLTKLLNQNQN